MSNFYLEYLTSLLIDHLIYTPQKRVPGDCRLKDTKNKKWSFNITHEKQELLLTNFFHRVLLICKKEKKNKSTKKGYMRERVNDYIAIHLSNKITLFTLRKLREIFTNDDELWSNFFPLFCKYV